MQESVQDKEGISCPTAHQPGIHREQNPHRDDFTFDNNWTNNAFKMKKNCPIVNINKVLGKLLTAHSCPRE